MTELSSEERKEQALKAYKKAQAPAWKAYEEAEAPAWKAYEEAEAPAWKAYLGECRRIDEEEAAKKGEGK